VRKETACRFFLFEVPVDICIIIRWKLGETGGSTGDGIQREGGRKIVFLLIGPAGHLFCAVLNLKGDLAARIHTRVGRFMSGLCRLSGRFMENWGGTGSKKSLRNRCSEVAVFLFALSE